MIGIPFNGSNGNFYFINYYQNLYFFNQSLNNLFTFYSNITLRKVSIDKAIIWFSNVTIECSNINNLSVTQANVTLICTTIKNKSIYNATPGFNVIKIIKNVDCNTLCQYKKDVEVSIENNTLIIGKENRVRIIIKNIGETEIKDLYVQLSYPSLAKVIPITNNNVVKIREDLLLVRELKGNITLELIIIPYTNDFYLNLFLYSEDPLEKTYTFKFRVIGNVSKEYLLSLRRKILNVGETTLLDLLFSLISKLFFQKE